MDDYTITDSVMAAYIEPKDQIIVDNDLCIVKAVYDADDPDEVIVYVDNLSDPLDDEPKSLLYSDEYDIWSY